MLEAILRLFTKPAVPKLGANVDTRSPYEKEKDYHISEIVGNSVEVNWVETPKENVRQFPVQNQNQKSDCVAETRRKLFRIIFKVNRGIDLDFSSVDLYRRRSNYPEEGMGAGDVIQLCRKQGMTLNHTTRPLSDDITTESGANAYVIEPHNVEIAKVFTIPNEVTFTVGDLETPAGTIQKTRKGVMVFYFFTAEEWRMEVPAIIDKTLHISDARTLHHSVTAVEPVMYQGKKGWWIEDSAHFGGLSRRFITEEFHKKRNFWASYPINFTFEVGAPVKPHYDGSTVSLQDCLKFEGLFPANVDSTGVYGNITTTAVKKFQEKYGLEQVGTVGKLTTAKLKERYP